MKKITIKEAKKIIKKYPEYIKLVLTLNVLSLITFFKNTLFFIKKRSKSYVFWASMGSFIYATLEHFQLINIVPESYEAIVSSLLGVLVFWGIIQDPTEKEEDKTVVESDGDMLTITSVPAPKKNKGKKAWENRFKNYGLWIAIASLCALFLPKVFNIPIDLGEWKTFVDAILSILVIFGVINNPTTDNSGYSDDNI